MLLILLMQVLFIRLIQVIKVLDIVLIDRRLELLIKLLIPLVNGFQRMVLILELRKQVGNLLIGKLTVIVVTGPQYPLDVLGLSDSFLLKGVTFMSCFYPLKGYKVGVNPSGKPNYKIASYKSTGVVKQSNGNYVPIFEDIWSDRYVKVIRDYIDIPCGHCVGCFLERSRQWADRCMLESTYHDYNSFITLTYDDFHLPDVNQLIDVDGVITDSKIHPLVKRDFQLFMKRLREYFEPQKIRFFACGEYGSQTFRPHYHAILFGVDFHEDRVLYKENFRGEKLYNSPTLDKLWKKGFCVIAPVTWHTCAYVSRYCLKKRENNLADFYDRFNVPPEFTIMSRRPGIARDYYEDNKESIYRTQEIYISDLDAVKKVRPPKYFDKLYDIDYPSDFERIKEDRQHFAEIQKELILDGTDLEYLDYLKMSEYNLSQKAKIFKQRKEV